MPFDKLSLKELKEHAKQHKDLIKGYTKMGKADLVKVMKKHLKIDRHKAVSRKGDPSKTHPGDMDYTTKLGDKDYHEGGHDELKQKSPYGGALGSDPRTWSPSGGSLLERIDKLKGGQLPSSIRDRLEHLEMKIKGGTITSGKPKKRITPIAVQQTDEEKIYQKLQQERREEMDKRLKEKQKPAEIIEELRKGGPSKGEQTFHNVVDRLSANVLAAHQKDARVQKKQKEDSKKPAKSCPITGYSKLKKGELLERLNEALKGKKMIEEGLVQGLEYRTVPELRQLARKYCGYKTPVERKAPVEKKQRSKDEVEAAAAMLDLQQRPVGGKVAVAKKEDDIDFEDLKWGSFTEQFNAYNRQHKKKFKDLAEFAQHIRANKGDFQPKTKKRADFYVNVISKKKS